MVEKNNKSLWIIGGAIAIMGAALIYNAMTEGDEVDEKENQDDLNFEGKNDYLQSDGMGKEFMDELEKQNLHVAKYDDRNP